MSQPTLTSASPGLKLGCIADDFTGATDLANNLVRAGMRVVQTIGVPDAAFAAGRLSGGAAGPAGDGIDAVVVALKSRTIPAADAVAQSLAALRWLRQAGAQQFYFKYCSTFDSTPAGNIGPVTEALMDALQDLPNSDFTIATPAFPDNGRTVFKGHLFVGDVLLSDSGMKDHPLTPMTDANLVRVLQAQCRRRVGLIDHRVAALGADAVRARIAQLRSEGVAIAVVDALSNDDLLRLGPALADLPLLTAGSGVAISLPANFGLAPSLQASRLPPARGLRAVISGSCSVATNRQVQVFQDSGQPMFRIDPLRVAGGDDVVAEALAWAAPRLADGPVLVASTAAPAAVKTVQGLVGGDAAGAMVEACLAAIARGLVMDHGVGQLIVAGGETSGACVQALSIQWMQIGPQIDPGVPWCHATLPGAAARGDATVSTAAPHPVHLALKSGNFGSEDFFTRAFSALDGQAGSSGTGSPAA